MINYKIYFLEFLNIIIELTNDYASPFKLWMGIKLFVVIHKPEEIQVEK